MKQHEDQRTQELPLPKRGRGRPATGKARTAAQRKQEQRSRDLTKVWEENKLNNVTITGLLTMLGQCSKPGWDANGLIAKSVWLELGKRRGFISDNHI